MIEKQFYCDDPLEYRSYGIFDLSKAHMINDLKMDRRKKWYGEEKEKK